MPFRPLHSWEVTAKEAIAIQESLSIQVIREDRPGRIQTVAGIDVGFEDGGATTRAAVVALSFPELAVVETCLVRRPTTYPYIPGLLSFREAPAVLEALEQMRRLPDLLICDGQGIAHPRRMGLASHLGLWTDIPSIGAAKSRLIGQHEQVDEARGAWQPLLVGDEIIGAALCTRLGVRPLYISIGHRVSLGTAIQFILLCTRSYRLPEPTRLAHHLASSR